MALPVTPVFPVFFRGTPKLCRTALFLVLVMLGGCIESPLSDDLTEARKAMREGEAVKAEKYLERYLQDESDPELRWEAWNELIEVLEYARRNGVWLTECLETMLVEFGTDQERTAAILARLGEESEKAGHMEKAAEYWARHIELSGDDFPQEVRVRRRLAGLYFRLRRFDAARKTLQECLTLPVKEGLRAECLYDLAENASTLEQLEEASGFAHQILRMEEVDSSLKSRAGFIVADIHEQRQQHGKALELFLSIRDDYPNPMAVDVRIEHLKKKK